MVKIARITTQKKNNQRYNIYLTHGEKDYYGFSVDEAILIEHHLRKGMTLSDAQLEQLKQKDNTYKSYTLAIHYLSYRMRTKKEMYDYLVQKDVEEEVVPQIIDRLVAEGLVDDQQFAEAFVNTRINTSNKGPQLVKRELIEKGVATTLAEAAIEKYTYTVQYEKAMTWAEKRLRTSKRDSFQKQQQKIRGNLMQKGFTPDVTHDVLEDIKQEQGTDEEWEALVFQGNKLLRRHMRKHSAYELQQKVKQGLYRQGFSFDKINQYIEEYVKERADD